MQNRINLRHPLEGRVNMEKILQNLVSNGKGAH